MTLNDNKHPRNTDFYSQYQSIGPPDLEEETGPFYRLHKGFVFLVATGCLLVVGVIFCGMLESGEEETPVYNNGSHTFLPTVLLISLDGVVNHDLDLSITPVLSQMAKDGARAKYMTPSFPPITFPNHWSLVTGLYPESHGIVGNYFFDSELNDTFYYKDPERSWDSKWWGGEPIWITAVKQNIKSGVIMWPGCSTTFQDLSPTYSVDFDNFVTFEDKVDQVFDWIDLPVEDRPQFIGLYMPQIDQAGHEYGPYANKTMKELRRADHTIGRLLQGISERNLTDIINIMIVSDHGMSETDKDRLIFYEQELTQEELSLISTIETYPILGIRLRPELDQEASIDILYRAFRRVQKLKPHFKVYKKKDMPSRFHFSNNNRIAPLIVLPETGWNFASLKDYDPESGADYTPRGVHGYDNLDPESRAIFVARGPHFPKAKSVAPFWNVELYNVMSRILHLNPTLNNNTLNGILNFSNE